MYTMKQHKNRVEYIASFFLLATFLIGWSLIPAKLLAQSFVPQETQLNIKPQTPEAGQTFKARVEAYSYDMTSTQISWSINGVTYVAGAGEQEISLPAPALGVPLHLTVQVKEQSGTTHTVTKNIVPSAVDIVIEGGTVVPHFYRGLPLPSAGSPVRFIAMPTLYTQTGTLVPINNLIYKWSLNGGIVQSGVKQVLTTTMPTSGSPTVEVTVETRDGTASHQSAIQATAFDPHMTFYEDDPLHGLAQNALPSDFTLTQDEISLRAVPYFVSPDIFNNAHYEWTLAGAPIQNPNADPQTLTLRKTGGAGSSRIEFSIRNLRSLLQSATGAFTVYFK